MIKYILVFLALTIGGANAQNFNYTYSSNRANIVSHTVSKHQPIIHHSRHPKKHPRRIHTVPEPDGGGVIAHPGFAWCGWWMQQHTGITSASTGLNLNAARQWEHVGEKADGPAPGVIGVLPHHVFQVTRILGPGTVMAISGNDSHRVRERPRRITGVIAWRKLS